MMNLNREILENVVTESAKIDTDEVTINRNTLKPDKVMSKALDDVSQVLESYHIDNTVTNDSINFRVTDSDSPVTYRVIKYSVPFYAIRNEYGDIIANDLKSDRELTASLLEEVKDRARDK